MDLTAADINEQQFHDAWRGYRQEEVDDFLDRVAEVVERVQRENMALQQRVRELETVLASARKSEEAMKRTMTAAQRAAEEAIAKARGRAEQLIDEAEEHARRADNEVKQRVAAGEIEVRRRTLEAEQEHNLKRTELDARIDRLLAFEADLKGRLQAFMRQQLRELDSLLKEAAPPAFKDETKVEPRGAGEIALDEMEGGRAEESRTGSPEQTASSDTS
jgi:cell division initiation protein